LEKLEQENKFLRELLITKNSGNSSKPPSTNIAPPAKRTSSLRKPTGKKPGGQLGHKGNNLEIVPCPDVIEKRTVDHCNACGLNLSDIPEVLVGKRQLIDIPPIKLVTTEQQVYKRTCRCGYTSSGSFSNNANAPVGYGENIESLVAYFHARHYLPVRRMKELFNDVFNTPISTGGICQLINRFANKTTPVYNLIKEKLMNSDLVGSDETGCKVNGKLHWFWTWQSPLLTYITHSPNRGYSTIEKHFPDGFPHSTLTHDAWKPHLNTNAKAHQLCIAHLNRELIYLIELHTEDHWAKDFLSLLQRSLKLKYQLVDNENASSDQLYERDQIINTFNDLLEKPPEKTHKKTYTFFKRMVKNEKHIFTFLYDKAVNPDNNASERAIRNIKVKQKMSGQFKAEESAMNFAKIRSIIDTTIKSGQDVLNAMKIIAENNCYDLKHSE
jgi:transposase